MSLINFSQIKGGRQALKDLEALKGLTLEELSFLDASKTKVSVERVVRSEDESIVMEGDAPKKEIVQLTVAEYLQQVEESINGAEGSLDDRVAEAEKAIESIEETLARPVHDRVRVQGTVVGGAAVATTELVAPVVSPDAGEYVVYGENNQQLFNAQGEVLTANVTAGTEDAPVVTVAFSNGAPHKKVVSYVNADGVVVEDADTDMEVTEKVEYVAVEEGAAFKVYPVAEFTLGALPQDALLDEEELVLIAYGGVIAQLSNSLAKDQAVIAEIINKVKTLATDEVIKQITDALAERLDTAEQEIEAIKGRLDTAEGDIDAVEGRLDTTEADLEAAKGRLDDVESRTEALEESLVEGKSIKNVQVDISVADLVPQQNENGQLVVEVTDLVVPFTAEVASVTEDKAILIVNGISYFEDKAFTFNREGKTISWTAADSLFPIEQDFELTLLATVVTSVQA